MRTITAILISLLFTISLYSQPSLQGFLTSADKHFEAEKKFDAQLDPRNLDSWMKRLAARPHHLGSAYGKENAIFMRDMFRSWGYEAELETYNVLFPTPSIRSLELVGPTRFKAKLTEPALKEDATSGQTKEQLPTYNAWSADGDVTAELVFVNYGVPDDYEQLKRYGIDVKGKIVIAKYGGSWRGIKPKVAQENGAIGCLIYSDPEEDGYYQGDVYPKGAFKNEHGAQRGSVQDMPVYPGDPLTPGVGATKDAKRIKREEATNLIKIPVLPISYGDAQPLLAALAGPVAPEHWRGALPITYHIGPGPAKVHLKVTFDWKMVECHNVIAKWKGSAYPDQWVIRGNHHDAWVNGANDPISGMVALMEEARAVAFLAKNGYPPKRTIVYCAWDGEEPSLIGSTEWVEHHADELKEKGVVYINSDSNGRGFLYAGGSHALENLLSEIARDVTDPQTKISILERRKAQQVVGAPTLKQKKDLLAQSKLSLGALGSGSDYSPFIQHLGIPSLNLGFGGEDDGGEYHSIYDSYDHFIKFKDPSFAYGITLAKTAGRFTLRIANADVLPFEFASLHKTIAQYTTDVIALLDQLREQTEIENQMIAGKMFVLASDPTVKYNPPTPKDIVPYLDFSPLQNALLKLEQSVKKMEETAKKLSVSGAQLAAFNEHLYKAEQALMLEKGLPRRPWYRHALYAPGFYTGYGVKTLPGIREAIEQRSWEEAKQQVDACSEAITRLADFLEKGSNVVSSQ